VNTINVTGNMAILTATVGAGTGSRAAWPMTEDNSPAVNTCVRGYRPCVPRRASRTHDAEIETNVNIPLHVARETDAVSEWTIEALEQMERSFHIPGKRSPFRQGTAVPKVENIFHFYRSADRRDPLKVSFKCL